MPGKPHKKVRVRVRTLDGRARNKDELDKLKSKGLNMPFLDIEHTTVYSEFIVCAAKDAQIARARERLAGVGLEAIDGDTTIAVKASNVAMQQFSQSGLKPGGKSQIPNGAGQRREAHRTTAANANAKLPNKPYGFVALPQSFRTKAPVWHDGTTSAERFSGELRFEIETLTPLLVGWERGVVGETASDWPAPTQLGEERLAEKKSVLCPLRAPWGQRPVVIPGDSLKGLLRHELGALLGAPMERVAERSYSYRPNALFTKEAGARLVARLARMPHDGFTLQAFDDKTQVRVPTTLELLPTKLQYDKRRGKTSNYYRFDDDDRQNYRGGQGAGERLNSKRELHRSLTANPGDSTETVTLSETVQRRYLATLRHLVDTAHGHFSERHPDVPGTLKGSDARERILKAARDVVFEPGDFIWVEWDTVNKCVVSLGWHYYYRWAYTDTVRTRGGARERHGLFALDTERASDAEGAPTELSFVRRLFGYCGDNEGSAGIGKEDHTQLMGRLFVNAALEVVGESDTESARFEKPVFLKELGMPRASAVEHYLVQPHHPGSRPSDSATLVTYGDAEGYDTPGELAGRKFYLDRQGDVTKAEDRSDTNKKNDRSTIALEASTPGRKFRFTVRFRDLDADELAAVAVALCPEQFKRVLVQDTEAEYCSKLGYARPLGWGSVRIEAKELFLLDEHAEVPTLKRVEDLRYWIEKEYIETETQSAWLAIHQRSHPGAGDYPRGGDGKIYTFHTKLRADHSRLRRYKREGL